jgi:cobalt-zinc-cadmium efflux system protein
VTIADIPPSESACILARLNHHLRERFHISHTTIQFEYISCAELDGCVVPMEELAGSQSRKHHSHAH